MLKWSTLLIFRHKNFPLKSTEVKLAITLGDPLAIADMQMVLFQVLNVQIPLVTGLFVSWPFFSELFQVCC